MSDTPTGLRPGIDYIGVGVGAVLMDGDGRFFLSQRGPGCKNERGKWEFPGGEVEFGETDEAAVIREFLQEYGVLIEVTVLLDVCNHLLPKEKPPQHWMSPTYLGRIVHGTPTILEPDKCTAIGWFHLFEIHDLDLSEITKHNLASLQQMFPHPFSSSH